MFRLNQMSDDTIQFSGNIEDMMFERESFVDEVYKLWDKIDNGEDVFGYIEKPFIHSIMNEQTIKSTMSVNDISHKIIDIDVDEEHDWVYGTIKVLDTPNGKQIKELLKRNLVQYLKVNPVLIGHYDENTNKCVIDGLQTFSISIT